MVLPEGMFDKYAGEIEDLRRSRSSLNKLNHVGQPALRPAPVVPTPVAAVAPRQVRLQLPVSAPLPEGTLFANWPPPLTAAQIDEKCGEGGL